MHVTRLIRAVTALTLVVASLSLAPAAAAHDEFEVGEYHLTIGWSNEPTIVGEPNAVELFITNHDEEPIVDLAGGAITVVVSTAGEATAALPLEPAFSIDGGFGAPGQYEAELLPTVPGEYTFQFAGTLHEETVDLTVTSGEETFSPVRSSSDIEFPVKVPTLADVATRLDRIDGRIETLQAAVPAAGAIDAVKATAEDALAAANQAATIGVLVGGLGLVVAVVALYLGWRAGRRGTRTA